MNAEKYIGLWKEFGEEFKDAPSVKAFINETINKTYDMPRLLAYLHSGGMVVAAAMTHYPNIFTGKIHGGSFHIKTDGLWYWVADLPDYIENHHLMIPAEWYEYIQANNFMIPDTIKMQNPEVDWG